MGGAGILQILACAAASAAAAAAARRGTLRGHTDETAGPAGRALQDVRQGLLQHLPAGPVRAVHARPPPVGPEDVVPREGDAVGHPISLETDR